MRNSIQAIPKLPNTSKAEGYILCFHAYLNCISLPSPSDKFQGIICISNLKLPKQPEADAELAHKREV